LIAIKLPAKKTNLDKVFLKERYDKEGLSSKEIADLTFSSRSAVTKLLKKHAIQLITITRKNNGGHVMA
jgi:hypothetical protein